MEVTDLRQRSHFVHHGVGILKNQLHVSLAFEMLHEKNPRLDCPPLRNSHSTNQFPQQGRKVCKGWKIFGSTNDPEHLKNAYL